MTAVVDDQPARKARHAAEMVDAAAALADHAPDDFHRRMFARTAFIYVFEFIRWARRAKNLLNTDPTTIAARKSISGAIERLAKDDFSDYADVRHRIAAHRQAIDGADPISRLQNGQLSWDGIDESVVKILADDVRQIWNLIAPEYGLDTLTSLPTVPQSIIDALGALATSTDGVRVGAGSFDMGRPGTALIIQGGELGERQRETVDVVRQVQVLCEIAPAVGGHEPYWICVYGALVTEACALAELVYGGSSQGISSLLELLEQDGRSPAITPLRASKASLDAQEFEHVKQMRNALGSHIDDSKDLDDLLDEFRALDATKLNAVLDNLFSAVANASLADVMLGSLRLLDASMRGVSLAEEPTPRPY